MSKFFVGVSPPGTSVRIAKRPFSPTFSTQQYAFSGSKSFLQNIQKSVSINRLTRYCNKFKSDFMNTQDLVATLPEWHSKPFRLTKSEIADPASVVMTFMDDFPLPQIRKTFDDWLNRILISNAPDPLNYIWFREELERFMEACYTSQERKSFPESSTRNFIDYKLLGQLAGIVQALDSIGSYRQSDGSFSAYIDYIKMITLNAKAVYESTITSSMAVEGVSEEEMLVEPFIQSCIDSFSIVSNLQNVRIERDVFVLPGTIGVIDFVKLQQIFSNLLLNAFKYAQSESYIIVRAHVYGEKIILKVISRGETIPKEQLQTIFESYLTLEKSKSGVGLGLYLCKQYTDLLGGNIEVRSKRRVTVFSVILSFSSVKLDSHDK